MFPVSHNMYFGLQNINPHCIRNIVNQVATVCCPVVCKKLYTRTFLLLLSISCCILNHHSGDVSFGNILPLPFQAKKKGRKRRENWDFLFSLVLERRQHITQMKQPTQIIHQVHWFCAALILCRANFWHIHAAGSAFRAEHAPK